MSCHSTNIPVVGKVDSYIVVTEQHHMKLHLKLHAQNDMEHKHHALGSQHSIVELRFISAQSHDWHLLAALLENPSK